MIGVRGPTEQVPHACASGMEPLSGLALAPWRLGFLSSTARMYRFWQQAGGPDCVVCICAAGLIRELLLGGAQRGSPSQFREAGLGGSTSVGAGRP